MISLRFKEFSTRTLTLDSDSSGSGLELKDTGAVSEEAGQEMVLTSVYLQRCYMASYLV